jgi:hypothetical protein
MAATQISSGIVMLAASRFMFCEEHRGGKCMTCGLPTKAKEAEQA